MNGNIYLLQEREFVKTNEQIFKIGKSKQLNLRRFCNYPKDSILLVYMYADNCDDLEMNILLEFRKRFISRKDIGNEYFEGNFKQMIAYINKIWFETTFKSNETKNNNTNIPQKINDYDECQKILKKLKNIINSKGITETLK